MYYCQNCPTLVARGLPASKVVVERRQRTYDKLIRRGPDRGKYETITGWEIVREMVVCPPCYTTLTGKEVQMRPQPVVSARPKFVPRGKKQDFRKPQGERRPPHKEKWGKRPPVVEVINPLPIVV